MEEYNKSLMEILREEKQEDVLQQLAQKAYGEMLTHGDYLIHNDFSMIEGTLQFFNEELEEWINVKDVSEIEPGMNVKLEIQDVYGNGELQFNNVREFAMHDGEVAISAENGFASSLEINEYVQQMWDETPTVIVDLLDDLQNKRWEIENLDDELREVRANAELDLAALYQEESELSELEKEESDNSYQNKGSLNELSGITKKYQDLKDELKKKHDAIIEELEKDEKEITDKIKEAEKEIDELKGELKYIRENKRHVTHDDLVAILKLDGTLEEIKQAVEKRELMPVEQDQIFKFLEAQNKEEADKAFKEILDNVDKIPTFDTPQEERDAWKNIRKDLVKDIADVNNRRLLQEVAYEDYEKQCNKSLQLLAGMPQTEAMQKAQEEMGMKLSTDKQKLDITTYQHSALGLMHAHAKSEERQASAKVFALESQPYRDFLKQSWDGLTDLTRKSTEYVKDTCLQIKERMDLSKEHAENRSEAIKVTKDLDFHPIENMKNKLKLAQADYLVKKSNREKAHAHKQEQTIIKKAEKILNKELKKEFDREQRQERLDAYGRGEKYYFDPKKFTPIKTASIKEAMEIVKDSKNPWTKIQCSIYKNTKRNGIRHEKEMLKNLEQIASNISRRQENVRNIYKDIATHQHAGDYGNGHKKFHDKLDQNYKDAQRSNTFGQSEFSGALRKAMEDHGYDFMIDYER